MSKLLGFESFRDLIGKCVYDFEHMNQGDPRLLSYSLFNIVNTLNHLFDWVLNDPGESDDIKMKCVKQFNAYRQRDRVPNKFLRIYDKIGSFPEINQNQLLVRQLSNGVKHMLPIETETMDVVIRDVPRGESAEQRAARRRETQEGKHYHLHIMSDDSGKPHDVERVCAELWEAWTMFPNA